MAEDTLSPKDFADALVEDPANPPQLQALTGYRGRSAKEGHTRLYLDPELSGWVDIPEDAILLTREVQDDYGLGKSVVWAKLDAQLEQGPQAAAGGGTGADFLQGQVAQDLGAGGAAGFAARPALQTQLGCPTHAPFLCLQTPPRLCPPTPQCPTHHPGICPSLGFTCTALPPCPHHTSNPVQCPSLGIACTSVPPCPPHTTNPAQCPSIVDACPTRLCHTQIVQQCFPQLTSIPQLCPVATPNPGCGPGGIGNPGGPVEGGQGVQAFGAQLGPVGVQNAHLNWVSQIIVCQPFHTSICPIVTHNIHQCIPNTVLCPVSPWCPWTFPITGPGPGTTPQFGHGGNVFAGAQAQGGMGVEAVTQPPQCLQPGHVPQAVNTHLPHQCLQPVHPTQLCPVQTHNILQCHPTLICHTHPVQACQPVSPWCPTGPITIHTTTPQQFTPHAGHFGGGGFAAAAGGQPTIWCPVTAGCPGPGGQGVQAVGAQGGAAAMNLSLVDTACPGICRNTMNPQNCPTEQGPRCPTYSWWCTFNQQCRVV